MKVFISWSGERSHAIANAFHDWLPRVIHVVKPWVSFHDIDKGVDGVTAIDEGLDGAQVGIICLTPENLEAPWIYFEAGAIASKKTYNTYLCIYLFQIKHSDIDKGPLGRYQSTEANKSETQQLIHTLNKALKDPASKEEALEITFLDKMFEEQWPKLEQNLKDISETQKEDDIIKIKNLISEPPIKVYGENDGEAMKDLEKYIDDVKPKKVRMVEYSSACVIDIIKHLIKTQTSPEIRLLIQHPAEVKSINGQPKRIWGVITGTYYQEKEIRDYRNLKILCYKQRTSFRGRNFDDKLINIGRYIYTYENNEQEVYGHNQPVITFREGYEGFSDIKRMFNYTFDNLWEHGISLDEVCKECKNKLPSCDKTKFIEWCYDVTPKHKKEDREIETTR